MRGDPLQFRASLVRVVGIDMAERSSLPLSPGQPGAARLCGCRCLRWQKRGRRVAVPPGESMAGIWSRLETGGRDK